VTFTLNILPSLPPSAAHGQVADCHSSVSLSRYDKHVKRAERMEDDEEDEEEE
jgi:hypothetical protein